MIVQDLVRMSKNIDLGGMSINTLEDDKLIDIINLGRIELHKRFALATKAEVLVLSKFTNVYSLRNTDVMQILNIYDEHGKELNERSVEHQNNFDYQKIAYNTILVAKNLLDRSIVVVYSSTPILCTNVDSNVDVPIALLECLLLYIAHKAYTGYNLSGTVDIGMSMYNKFEASCAKINELGLMSNNSLLTHSSNEKGFV